MTILNISLCLPEWDVAAITQGRSIVAVTERFVVPGKAFVLLPCRDDVAEGTYRTDTQEHIKNLQISKDVPIAATHWAQCSLCQQIPDEDAVVSLGDRTIWSQAALLNHLKTRGRLFLSFLQVYELPSSVAIEAEPSCEQLYKFLPLPQTIEASFQNAVLSEAKFAADKQALLEPSRSSSEVADRDDIQPEIKPAEDILNAPNWIHKISEVGNSSDGHTFEKLVRKGLIELGFSNTLEKAEASLNPHATGGAGGIDFYANKPYRIVGECKASKHARINTDAATQIVRLGLQNLREEDYLECIKIVVAGGALTTGAKNIAEGHRINVIRPETMQRLVESKVNFSGEFDLFTLKRSLESEPFGESADLKINDFLDWCQSQWTENQEHQQLRRQSIQSLNELSQQSIASPYQDFSVVEIRTHHNAKYEPAVTDSRMERLLEQLYVDNKISRRRYQANDSTGYYPKNAEITG